jgi:hypothetical protein
MKNLIIIATCIFLSANILAARVEGLKLDPSEKYLLIDVAYRGGCETHDFALELESSCKTSSSSEAPQECKAKLIEYSTDACGMTVLGIAVIPLNKYKLDSKKFSGTQLTILGDKSTSATIKLP